MQIQILFSFNGTLFSKIAAMHLKYEHALISFLFYSRREATPLRGLQVLIGEDLTNQQCLFFLACLVLSQLLMARVDGTVSHLPDVIRAVDNKKLDETSTLYLLSRPQKYSILNLL